MSVSTARRAAWLAVLVGLAARGVAAVEVKSFRAQSAQSFAAGTLAGVSLDALGRLRAGARIERLAAPDEPFVFAAALVPATASAGARWILGTGNAGKVLEVTVSGSVRTLFATPEPEIFAVWVDPDGTIYAGSSPNGKVYRYRDGKSEPFFDPKATYIWALTRSAGELLVATGTEGKLYAVAKDGTGRLFYDAEDTHARALTRLPSGEVLLGTAGEGLIVAIDTRGKARTLYDASPSEIVAFAVAPDGVIYAGGIESEAGFTEQPSAGRTDTAASGTASGGSGAAEAQGQPQGTVTVALGGEEEAARAAPPGGLRSEVYRIAPSGLVEIVWTSKTDSVLALAWADRRAWLGTGAEGKLWSLVDDTPVLENDFEERQIVAILPDAGGTALSFVTTNAGGVHRATASGSVAADQPTYTSAALDAGSIARFGSFRWRGVEAERGRARFAFRSGLAREPDRTWTVWSEWTEARSGADLSLAALPPGRYVQWRARFEGAVPASVSIASIELTYRPENGRPRIRRFNALEPGEVLVPANFNPSNQVFEPAHPDRQGFFTPLAPATGSEESRLKTLWKKGYRTLRWDSEDPNQDALEYRIDFRSEPAAATASDSRQASVDAEGAAWLPMAEELTEGFYGFDETVLPDGLYRFRLRASDAAANASGEGLEAERLSEPVVVDGTPPRLQGVRRERGRLHLEVSDDWNPLRAADWSADAEEWEAAPAADGLVDGRREELVVAPPAQARLVLVRVIDAAFNVVTFDLSAAWRGAESGSR